MIETAQAMTIAQVATRLKIGEAKVLKLIESGVLEAFDLSIVGVGARRTRVMPESIERMLRKAAVRKRKPNRRRGKIDPEVEKWL